MRAQARVRLGETCGACWAFYSRTGLIVENAARQVGVEPKENKLNVRQFFLVVLPLLTARFALAQGTISTVAGGNGFLEGVPATQARLDGPQALAVDPQGNAYISDGLRTR